MSAAKYEPIDKLLAETIMARMSKERAEYNLDNFNKIKSAINRVDLDHNITVMRGLPTMEVDIIKSAIATQVYTVYTPGFLSTTLRQNVAQIFAKAYGTRYILVLNVFKSKGTGALLESIATNKGEWEFLINAGKTYRLYGQTTIGDYTYYLANLIV
jgi:hypothetical protein